MSVDLIGKLQAKVKSVSKYVHCSGCVVHLATGALVQVLKSRDCSFKVLIFRPRQVWEMLIFWNKKYDSVFKIKT